MGTRPQGGAPAYAEGSAVQSQGVDGEGPESDSVFFMGMPKDATVEKAEAIISQYGDVKQCHVVGAGIDAPSSTFFVQMNTVAEAKWLRENLDNNIPQGLVEKVNVRYANIPGLVAPAASSAPAAVAPASNRYSPYGTTAAGSSASREAAYGLGASAPGGQMSSSLPAAFAGDASTWCASGPTPVLGVTMPAAAPQAGFGSVHGAAQFAVGGSQQQLAAGCSGFSDGFV